MHCSGLIVQSKSVSSTCGGRATFLCLARETWPKERPPPLGACRASLPGKSVSRGRAFRQHIHVLAKRDRPPADSPAGLSSPTHRRTGAPGRAAGHPGPHSVRRRCAAAKAEEAEQKVSLRAGRFHCCECLSSANNGRSATSDAPHKAAVRKASSTARQRTSSRYNSGVKWQGSSPFGKWLAGEFTYELGPMHSRFAPGNHAHQHVAGI